MVVNAVYWALGLERQIPPEGCKADLVGEYHPTAFGFGGHRKGVKPVSYAMEIGAAVGRSTSDK
jgi:hypothetical protein